METTTSKSTKTPAKRAKSSLIGRTKPAPDIRGSQLPVSQIQIDPDLVEMRRIVREHAAITHTRPSPLS